MLGEICREELAIALDSVASDVLATTDYQHGAVDCLQLAQSLGLSVAWDSVQAGRARFVRLQNTVAGSANGAILLRPDPRRERLHWAMAHEIGEHRAHVVFERLGVDARESGPGQRESVANWLAGRILLPNEAFLAAARSCDWDLPRLKQCFSTASHELIARRMLDFEPPVAITLFDHGRVTFRRGNTARVPPLLPIERRCQLLAHAEAQTITDCDGALSVQAWPIHESDWKREILRSSWNGEFS